MEICPRCKSSPHEPRVIRYTQEFKGNIIIVDNVPVRICSQCGEIILSDNVAEAIQNKIWSDDKPNRIEQVPVYELV